MQFFFADDSAQKGARSGMGKIVAFGGVLIAGDQLRTLSQRIDEIAASFGIPAADEIKWSPKKGSWIHSNLQGDRRARCYKEILSAAQAAGCKAVVTTCDFEMRNIKPEWGFERCVTYTLERVSTYLSKSSQQAVIIADRPSGGHKEADQFLEAFVEHLSSDHNHMIEKTFSLNMLTAQSHMTRHLQVADLVVSITTAMVAGQTKWAAEYFDAVKSMFLQNALGYIGGTGLKVYPDKLINLYHWVLGETAFVKAGNGTGLRLPSEKSLYFSDCGI